MVGAKPDSRGEHFGQQHTGAQHHSGARHGSITRHDSVARRLAELADAIPRDVIHWQAAQQQRQRMRRRAAWCSLSAWLLLSVASLASCLVAAMVLHDARELLQEDLVASGAGLGLLPPMRVPWMLGALSAAIILGGPLAWRWERFPGWSRTAAAIDWSSSGDAIAKLLTAGCTYPEAFRLASDVVHTRSTRNWLATAAKRVEAGGKAIPVGRAGRGDTALVEALLEAADEAPERHWRIASDHFLEVATQRLLLLLHGMPMIATILSGLLVWFAVSATLGWLWRGLSEMLRGWS